MDHPTYQKDPSKERIEEMNRLIRNLLNKVINLKVEGQSKSPNQPPQNPPFFCKPFHPQQMNRDRRNMEQNIRPPMRRGLNLQTDEYTDEYEKEGDINWVGDQGPTFYITEND